MHPHERSLVKQLAKYPFSLIGVNSDKDLEQIQLIVKEKELNWRSFWNGPEGTEGPIARAWNIRAWPTTYLIDAKGKLRFKNLRDAELENAIETLLAELDVRVKLETNAHRRSGR